MKKAKTLSFQFILNADISADEKTKIENGLSNKLMEMLNTSIPGRFTFHPGVSNPQFFVNIYVKGNDRGKHAQIETEISDEIKKLMGNSVTTGVRVWGLV